MDWRSHAHASDELNLSLDDLRQLLDGKTLKDGGIIVRLEAAEMTPYEQARREFASRGPDEARVAEAAGDFEEFKRREEERGNESKRGD